MAPTQDVARRTVAGLGWTATSAISQQTIQFFFGAILARALAPNDFGLIAMIGVFTGFALIFVDLGLGPAIVQRPDVEERHLSSAFWITLGMGSIAAIATIAVAPAVASFYDEPELLGLMIAGSPAFVIASAGVVQMALLEREMNFRRLALIDNFSYVSGGIVALAMALYGLGAWSLIGLVLSGAFVRSASLWVASSWRPTSGPDRLSVTELWGFSGHFTGFTAVNYWSSKADDLLIGRFVGAAQLAFYSRAYGLMNTPVGLTSSIASRVMFPALSRVQSDTERARRIYLRALGLLGFITFPVVVGMLVAAKPFILTVYGQTWEPVVPILQILCVASLMRCLYQATGWVFTSQGRADTLFHLSIVWSLGVILAFFIGLHWGVLGIAAAYSVCNVLFGVPVFLLSGRLIGATLGDVVRALAGVGFAAILMGVAVMLVALAIPDTFGVGLQLLLEVLTGACVYALTVHFTSPGPYREFRRLVSDQRRRHAEMPFAAS